MFISTHFPPLCPNIFSACPDEHSNHLGTQYFSSWVDAKECALYGEAGFLSCHCHLHVHKYMPCDLSSFCNKEQLLVRIEKAPPVSFLKVSQSLEETPWGSEPPVSLAYALIVPWPFSLPHPPQLPGWSLSGLETAADMDHWRFLLTKPRPQKTSSPGALWGNFYGLVVLAGPAKRLIC